MGIITKRIPLWIKEPICVFLNQLGKVPLSIAFWHSACDYADTKKLSTKKRVQIYHARQRCVYNHIRKKYGYLVDESVCDPGEPIPNCPIWVFWWQGFGNAPELVRICYASLKKNCGKHPVIALDQYNYMQYVDLPSYITEKVKNGVISLTHFSDILRLNLLATHGGFWCDATIYCTKPLNDDWLSTPIVTCRSPGNSFENVSDWNWTGYALGGYRGNPLFTISCDILNEYWKEQLHLVDYFLIDYIIKLVFYSNSSINQWINQIPSNNTKQTYLQDHFGEIATEEMKDLIAQGDTWLYKTSWKTEYPKTVDDQETVYGYFLRINQELVQ